MTVIIMILITSGAVKNRRRSDENLNVSTTNNINNKNITGTNKINNENKLTSMRQLL